MKKVLEKLWEEGRQVLDIYYPEEIHPGEEEWAIDVYQDEINDRCHLNWTWTVLSEKQLEKDNEKEENLPDWVIVVDEPFSEDVACKALEKWLRDRKYKFGVRMISLDETKGSGLIKKLRQMNIEAEKKGAVPMDIVTKEDKK
jgi:hypothetical protein